MRVTGGSSSSSALRLGPPSVAALVLVLAPLLLVETAAAGEGPPAAPPKPVELRMENSSVIVSDSFGGELVIRHAPGSHLVPKNQNLPRAGGVAFYGHSCYLMIVRADVTEAARAVVVKRVVFPGVIQSIATSEGGLPVGGHGLPVTVTVRAGGDDAETMRYSYPPRPDEPRPTVFPLDEAAFAAPMADALKLVPGLRRDGSIIDDEREAARGRVKLLQSAFAANPTNPWFKLYEGAVRRSDDYAAARAAFRAAVDVEGAPAFDYLRMSALLASMGEMAESDVAFERGFGEFVRRGLEPELLMSPRALERVYALPLDGPSEGPGTAHAVAMAKAREAGDTDAMVSLAERIWRLAPRCEGVTFTFAGIAEHLKNEGRKVDAAVWFERAEAASRFAGLVGGRHVFYAGASCLAALVVLLAICFVKARPRQKKDLAPLGGWLGSWRWTWERFTKMAFAYATRKELVGVFLVAATGFALSHTAIRAERGVFRASKLPESLKSGTWAHPGAVPYLEKLSIELRRPENRLLFAIARQQETQNSVGREVYEKLGGDDRLEAVAQNNMGVGVWESTDVARAGGHFRRARDLDPGLAEAFYNDEDREAGGGQVGSVRTSRARRYLRNRKLIALPDADTLAVAFAGTEVQGEAGERVGGLGILKPLAWLTLVLSAIVAVLVLPFIVMRRKAAPERRGGVFAGIGYVFPGTSARLAPTGGLLLAAWIYCLIVVVLVVRGDAGGGVDELGRIVERTFGISGSIVFPFESAMMIFGPAAFVGFRALNGLLLARATKLARAASRAAAPPPKPDGPGEGEKPEEGPAVPAEAVEPDEALESGQVVGQVEEPPAAEEDAETPAEEEEEEEEEGEEREEEQEESSDEDEATPTDPAPVAEAAPAAREETAMTSDILEEPAPKKAPQSASPSSVKVEKASEDKVSEDEPLKPEPTTKPIPPSRQPTPPPVPAERPVEKPKPAEAAKPKTEEKPAPKPSEEKSTEKPGAESKPAEVVAPDEDAGAEQDEDDYQPPL